MIEADTPFDLSMDRYVTLRIPEELISVKFIRVIAYLFEGWN